jgi:hypothetical protein
MRTKLLLVHVAIILAFCSGETHAQQTQGEVTRFAEDVLLHVVLHEVGHGLIREFDLPILGNEETMADAFATCYVTQFLPDRAYDVLNARITSLMIEAGDVPRAEWRVTGEHNNDARRAHQIAALAVAADPEKFDSLAQELGMSETEITKAKDYGSEIHRSWRRILRPLMMTNGMQSSEARIRFDASCDLVTELRSGRLVSEIESALTRFDWHSQVTILFAQGDGGAGWSRTNRTITVHTEYVRRFIRQGAKRQKK